MHKTYMQKQAEIKRDWHLLDAQGMILGRLATDIAKKLIGKDKVSYTPHVDGGDFVVVINAKEVAVTGQKETDKMYYRHSGFPGGFRQTSLEEVRATDPSRLIEKAVFNMLPKNKLRAERMNRLKVYAGSEHPHNSQLAK